MNEHVIEPNGVPLFVRTAGDPDAYPLVLLHGWPESSHCWSRVVPLLADEFRLLMPDLRGFGRSGIPEGADAYRMKEVLGDIVGVLQWAGVSRASVVGHDFGGAVAWQCSAHLSASLDAVVAIAAPWPERMREIASDDWRQLARSYYVWLMQTDEGLRLLTQNRGAVIAELAFGDLLDPADVAAYIEEWNAVPGRLEAMANWYRVHFSPALFDPTVPLDLRRPRTPTRYVHGEKDFAFVAAGATGSAKFVEAPADEVTIAGASHWMPHTHPEEVARLVKDWVNRHR